MSPIGYLSVLIVIECCAYSRNGSLQQELRKLTIQELAIDVQINFVAENVLLVNN